ncbi:MAG: transposase [Anaerolineales bacterium]
MFLCTSCSAGHNRGACLFDDQNRYAYLGWLHDTLHLEPCLLHAHAPMTNHVHLLITPRQGASVSRLIISVGRRSVHYVNHAYRRTGTPWDSRYKSALVQAETDLLLYHRDIELNPVRAGLVSDPADHP